MAQNNSRDRLDRSLARRGEDAVIRRAIGTSPATYAEAPLRILIRGYKPEELSGGVVQGDSKVIASPTSLLAVSPTVWPGKATGTLVPKNLDQVTIQGRLRSVQAVAAFYENSELVRLELQVRG
ncbi:hypothetical protein [Methylobacterium sp. WL6]|uniref:hypothetical protein n=1 Tax=Methylobacterium sp. WL6 TaxID=2603901 RepID=UPI001FEF4C64|nr:hypothetical protein [Methylobacterium sp. WL6]